MTSPMQRALALAREALGTTRPNPSVGAVLVKNGRIVGEGVTQPPGQPHAEIMALRQAKEQARGATLYVTLEPCPHYGRTPPCTRAILEAGIAQVHMAMIDPNPLVSGKGEAELDASGIPTSVGDREEEARQLCEPHSCYSTTSLPYVIAKFAMSLDGKIATATGSSQWITGEEARRCSHDLRRIYDAVMVGIGTVLADDPLLTHRSVGDTPSHPQPLRVIVDSDARTPPTSQLLAQPGETLVATARPTQHRVAGLEQKGAEVLSLPGEDGRVDLHALLRSLGQREITSVMVEGGGALLGSLFDQRLVDKVLAFVAPIIVGGRDAPSPVEGTGARHIAESLKLRDVTVEHVGEDLMLTGYCRSE